MADGAGNVLALYAGKSMLREKGVWSRLGPDFTLDDRWTRIDDKSLVAKLLGEWSTFADTLPR